jgi:DNA (cytosine-5)-methyltransferase 1
MQEQEKIDLTVASFFAGIGGFDRGLQRSGFVPKFQCEIDDFCSEVLASHWPDTYRLGDIRKLKGADIPDCRIWCGGFPCQDLSVARGNKTRTGLKGDNSGLFFEFFRLIQEKSPEVILLENVTGLLNSHGGRDFGIVLNSLTQIGYAVSWRVLNSRFFGVPQSRPRVFMCAWKGAPGKAVRVLHEDEKPGVLKNLSKEFRETDKDSLGKLFVPKLAFCIAATSGRHTGTDWSRTYVSYFDRVRRITPLEAERIQGYPDNWTQLPAAKLGRFGKDLDSQRYHAVGNAVSVPVIEWIGERVMSQLRSATVDENATEVARSMQPFGEASVRIRKVADVAEVILDTTLEKMEWLSGGLAYGEEIIDANVTHYPEKPKRSSLLPLIEKNYPDEKYFISASAAQGILRRVDSQNRNLFEPLRNALSRLANRLEPVQ